MMSLKQVANKATLRPLRAGALIWKSIHHNAALRRATRRLDREIPGAGWAGADRVIAMADRGDGVNPRPAQKRLKTLAQAALNADVTVGQVDALLGGLSSDSRRSSIG